jgi:dCMP deaminase
MDDKWNQRFINLATEVSSWSKDTSTKVGAVIMTADRLPVSFGYNGMPPGIDDTKHERHQRPEKYFWFEHAERNAIYQADRHLLTGSVMYVTHFPCADCARAIIKSKISEIVYDESSGINSPHCQRNLPMYRASLEMLTEAGIKLTPIKIEKG